MKKTMINQSHIEGVLYEHNLEAKVSGDTSKNPGTPFISGTISIATDNAMTNIVPVHFTYVTATFGSGKPNDTYTTLNNIINGTFGSYMKDGADKAVKLRVDSALGLNEFYTDRNGKEELVSAKHNEGGFVHKIDNLEFLLVERFDRIKYQGDDVLGKDSIPYYERILQEDFAQALGVQSRDKYSITIKDCLKVLNQTQSPVLAKSNFVKQVIFNYLIGNTDAHGKNFSIYWFFNKINLTPAYDLLCSSIYDCDQRIAMKIGKAKFYADVTEKDWELFAQDLDISPKVVFLELERQKKLLPKVIEKLAKELDCEVGYKILDYVKARTLH